MRKPIWLAAAVVILISAAVLFFSWRAHRLSQLPAVTAITAAPEAAVPAIRNPLPEAPAAAPALPALDESDAALRDGLGELLGKATVERIFKPELLVRHIVVSIDNLSRRHLAVELRPTRPLPGAFIASGNDQQGYIDIANFRRYTPYVQTLQALDMRRLAMLYLRFYPLFQQAYQSLGYPNGYFNDRLVVTIDNLLAAPDITTDIALIRPNVMYQFADPKLEDLSAGQKLMLRMGPGNAAIVKAKLRELRTQITGGAHDLAPDADSSAPGAGSSSSGAH